MKLYRTQQGVIAEAQQSYYLLNEADWDALINRDNLYQYLSEAVKKAEQMPGGGHIVQQYPGSHWQPGSMGCWRYLFPQQGSPNGRIQGIRR